MDRSVCFIPITLHYIHFFLIFGFFYGGPLRTPYDPTIQLNNIECF